MSSSNSTSRHAAITAVMSAVPRPHSTKAGAGASAFTGERYNFDVRLNVAPTSARGICHWHTSPASPTGRASDQPQRYDPTNQAKGRELVPSCYAMVNGYRNRARCSPRPERKARVHFGPRARTDGGCPRSSAHSSNWRSRLAWIRSGIQGRRRCLARAKIALKPGRTRLSSGPNGDNRQMSRVERHRSRQREQLLKPGVA
jgi:hypothetical protein